MSDPIKLKLSKPIMAHGEQVDELEFRAPLTKDIIEIGLPTLIIPDSEGGGGIEIRQPIVAKYISRLAAIPKGSVESLEISDFANASGVVMGFFGMADGETSAN